MSLLYLSPTVSSHGFESSRICLFSFLPFVDHVLINDCRSLAASIFAPAVPQVMEEFEKTSTTLGTLVVSIYVLGLAISPLIISPLSEQFGRLWIYHACNLLFCVFNVACALSQSLPQLIVFRLFTGCFGAAPVSMGGGTMADIFPPEKRGAVMSLWAIGPLFGPVIGPIAGGFLASILLFYVSSLLFCGLSFTSQE